MSSPTPHRAATHAAALVEELQAHGLHAERSPEVPGRVTARMGGLRMVLVLVGGTWFHDETPDRENGPREHVPLHPAGLEQHVARAVRDRLANEAAAYAELWKLSRPRTPEPRRVYPKGRVPLPRRSPENDHSK